MKSMLFSMNNKTPDLRFANAVASAVHSRVDEIISERDRLINLLERMLPYVPQDYEDEKAVCSEARKAINNRRCDGN